MEKSILVLHSCFAFIFGIGLFSLMPTSFFIYQTIIFLVLIFLVLIKADFFKKNLILILFVAFFFLFGVWRCQISFDRLDENHISFYNGQKIIFQGIVVEEPEITNNQTKLILAKITIKNKNLKGKVLVSAPFYVDYQRQDFLQVDCFLQRPKRTNDFNYEEYLAKSDIYSFCLQPEIKILKNGSLVGPYSYLLKFKNRAKNLIDVYFTEPQGAIISAVLLGIKKQIPSRINDWFAQSGIAHVLAISGLHVSILCQLIFIFLSSILLIRRQKTFWPTVIIVIVFVILSGASPSAVRAGIMGLALILSQRINRSLVGKRVIIYAATLMLLFNPRLLKSDISFQLSFLSVLGISFLLPIFNKLLIKIPDYKYFPLRQYLATSLSAQIFVLPLILHYFGNLSLIAPLSNIFAFSLMPLVMFLGFLFIVLGQVCSLLAKIIFYPLWILTTLLVLIAKFGASIPYLSFVLVGFSWFWVAFFYLLIILWLIKINGREKA